MIYIKTWTYDIWLIKYTPRLPDILECFAFNVNFLYVHYFYLRIRYLMKNNFVWWFWYVTKCRCSSSHRANLVIFLYSVLDNFPYFRGIWFLFNVSNHHDTCIKGLLQNAIWFIWNDNLGGFQHHDLLPLDIKKNNYCRIHHLWIRQSVLNVHNVIVMAVTKTYLHCFITTLRWLLHVDALHQAFACFGLSITVTS